MTFLFVVCFFSRKVALLEKSLNQNADSAARKRLFAKEVTFREKCVDFRSGLFLKSGLFGKLAFQEKCFENTASPTLREKLLFCCKSGLSRKLPFEESGFSKTLRANCHEKSGFSRFLSKRCAPNAARNVTQNSGLSRKVALELALRIRPGPQAWQNH